MPNVLNTLRLTLASAVVAVGIAGCAQQAAPVVGITATPAFGGKWSGTWDITYNKGTTTFVVGPDGTFTGTMFSSISDQTWPFQGSITNGTLNGSVAIDKKTTFVLKGPAAVYSGSELKATAEAYKSGHMEGSCLFDVKR